MGAQQFGSDRRLSCTEEFRRVFKHPDYPIVHTRYFRVYATRTKCGMARLGIAVGRRAVKHAADRNRIKRHIRESFRRCDLPVLDFVVVCRPEIQTLTADKLRDSLSRCWERFAAANQIDHG